MTDALQHARDVYMLEGTESPEQAWLGAVACGRLHHAWLLAGPEGVGKATFAHCAARRLLGARPEPSRGLLGADPEDSVARLIAARAHPDLLVIERGAEESKSKRAILVDDARRMPEFFSKSPSIAPWRVAIIDAADDLTNEAANAVLKTLEEPPAQGIVLLVAHAPGRLLPTIRSRCRRLNFAPWTTERVAEFLVRKTDIAPDEAHRLAELSHGAPGRALRLLAQDALELDGFAAELLSQEAGASGRILTLAEKMRGGEGAERFALLMRLLGEHVRTAALQSLGRAPLEAEQLAAAWERLAELPGEVDGLNLDRAEAIWTTAAELRSASR